MSLSLKKWGLLAEAIVLCLLSPLGAIAGDEPEPPPDLRPVPSTIPSTGKTPAVFEPNYDFEVVMDGKQVPEATCYNSQTQPGMLLLGTPLGGAIFTRMDRKVVSVNPAKIHVRGERVFVSGDAYLDTLTSWQLDGDAAELLLQGKKVRIQPRPLVLGQTTAQDVIEKTPLYRHLMSLYQPDAEALGFLKQYGRSVDIEVYFGSWCHVCKQYLPQFLRTITDCANPNFHVTLFGLPRDFSKDDKVTKEKQVKGIPCIILYSAGQEIGRIEGPPRQSYEKDLGGLLRLVSSKGDAETPGGPEPGTATRRIRSADAGRG